MAARCPGLDIFSQGLVERIEGGWRITEKGRSFLQLMEARTRPDDAQLGVPQLLDQRLERVDGPYRIQGLALRNQRRQARRQRRIAALKANSPAREGLG